MSAPIVSAKGPRPRRDSHTLAGSDVVGRHLNFNFDKKNGKMLFFVFWEGRLTFRASERLASSFSMFPAAVTTSCCALLVSTVK